MAGEYMELHAIEELAKERIPSLWEEERRPQRHPTTVFPAVTPPGMAYVPYQQWGEVYDTDKGFRTGTVFPVLDYPFMSSGGEGK